MDIKKEIMSKIENQKKLYDLCKEYRKTMSSDEIIKIFYQLIEENEGLNENDNFLNVADCLVGWCNSNFSLKGQ